MVDLFISKGYYPGLNNHLQLIERRQFSGSETGLSFNIQ